MRALRWVCVAFVPVFGLAVPPALAQSAGGADGEVQFNTHCRQCHSFKPKDNRLGPSLHGIIGKKAGSVEGYGNYSESLKKSGLTWDDATLDKFIEAPDKVIPGNNMKPYAGLSEAQGDHRLPRPTEQVSVQDQDIWERRASLAWRA